MSQELWNRVDVYLSTMLVPEDVGDAALQSSAAAGLPAIQVSAMQACFLSILARSIGARRILEIGTLGGYSSIWLAEAIPPGGKLITLELDERHANLARANIRLAGAEQRVDIRQGPAVDSLAQLASESDVPFDLIFIDADKPNAVAYFEWAVSHTRPGGLIIVDNVVRNGEIINSTSVDPDVLGMQRLIRHVSNEKRVTATVIQTVGSKGYDGFVLAVVGDRP